MNQSSRLFCRLFRPVTSAAQRASGFSFPSTIGRSHSSLQKTSGQPVHYKSFQISSILQRGPYAESFRTLSSASKVSNKASAELQKKPDDDKIKKPTEDEVIYKMPLVERGAIAVLKTAAVSGVSLSWLLVALNSPYLMTLATMDLVTLAVAAIYTRYLLKQSRLWTADKPMKIEYNHADKKYTLTYRYLMKRKVTFTAGEVDGPRNPVEQLKSDLEKHDTTEKRDLGTIETFKALFRQPNDGQTIVIRRRTPEQMVFRMDRQLMNLESKASRIFYRKQIKYVKPKSKKNPKKTPKEGYSYVS